MAQAAAEVHGAATLTWEGDPVPSLQFPALAAPPPGSVLPSTPRERSALPSSMPSTSPTSQSRTTNKTASLVRTASCFHSLSQGKGPEAIGVGQTLEGGQESARPAQEGCTTDVCVPGNALGHPGAGSSAIFGKGGWYVKRLPIFCSTEPPDTSSQSTSCSEITLLNTSLAAESLRPSLISPPSWGGPGPMMAPPVTCFLLAVLFSASCEAIISLDQMCMEVSPSLYPD